MEIVGLID